jgi:uncharacterized protein YlzI (FlbEa/FlbD family)
MKLLCVTCKDGSVRHLFVHSIESMTAVSGGLVTIQMASGAKYKVSESIQHLKDRIEHGPDALDVR